FGRATDEISEAGVSEGLETAPYGTDACANSPRAAFAIYLDNTGLCNEPSLAQSANSTVWPNCPARRVSMRSGGNSPFVGQIVTHEFRSFIRDRLGNTIPAEGNHRHCRWPAPPDYRGHSWR